MAPPNSSRWLRLPRWLRLTLQTIGALVLLLALVAAGIWWYFTPTVQRTNGVVYGQRHGAPLTLDIIRPAHPNGLGVALMVSGGWKSGAPGGTPVWLMARLLRRGYTVFPVCHLSQPKATVMEIQDDMQRGIRFLRLHAREYGVDPARLGVTGGSAGGHLGLMLGTRGGPGNPEATDPIDRESSAVQAVAVFYPVTDLLNLGASTENLHDGGPPRSFVKAFGPQSTNLAAWKEIGRSMSPIYHIHPHQPPMLIIHGGADTLVTADQSVRFQAEARKLGQTVELIIRPGRKHGWLLMVLDVGLFADWFDRYLK